MREYRKRGDVRVRANATRRIETAVFRGRLRKRRCADCGSENTKAYVNDPNKRVDAIWLCEEHKQKRSDRKAPVKCTLNHEQLYYGWQMVTRDILTDKGTSFYHTACPPCPKCSEEIIL